MSEGTSTSSTSGNPGQVSDARPSRNWGKILVSSALGAGVAVVMAPTIAASAPIGVGWLIASNMTAGVLGSITTKIAGNAIGANVTEIQYNPHRARLRFRAAIIDHFDTYLGPVIDCIRSNSSGTFSQESILRLTGSLVFLEQVLRATAQENSSIYLRYEYAVVPNRGSPSRAINDGPPPSDLPVYHEDASATLRLNEPEGILDGVAGAMARGALFGGGVGIIGQALGQTGHLFERMFVLDTAPGMNMVFSAESISAAADPLHNLMIPGPSSEERAAYLIELIAEIQLHINRVSQCAINNGVGLVYSVELGIHHGVAANTPGAGGANRDTIWNRWESSIGV